ncbi:MAG: hypothetical protein FWH51_02950 [Dehalococcoidia bacterium]|nr:hypothetical protein [Dehalococcoidia bacterium]
MKKLPVILGLVILVAILPACLQPGTDIGTSSKYSQTEVIAIAQASNTGLPPDREGITYSANFTAARRSNTSWEVIKTTFGTYNDSGISYTHSTQLGTFYEDTGVMAWS